MTILRVALCAFAAGLLSAMVTAALLRWLTRPRFPKDHCRDCRAPILTDAERHERTDAEIDAEAERIHREMMEAAHG